LGSNIPKKVLFLARPAAVSGPGGFQTHVSETKTALERLGVQVDLILRADLDFTNYDIVHIFAGHGIWLNVSYFAMKAAKKAGVPVAVSTIYWDHSEWLSKLDSSAQFWQTEVKMPLLKKATKYAMPAPLNAVYSRLRLRKSRLPLSDYYHWHKLDRKMPRTRSRDDIVKEMFLEADILLPNSHAEMDHLRQHLGVENKYHVVPNGADLSFTCAKPDWFVNEFGVKDFVMCAAYLSERKNQLALIRAMKNTSALLVLTGPAENQYSALCRKEAGSGVLFTGPMSKEEIASAYAAAKVHVLPSYYETPGLASLEAALAGCTIVSTDRGCTREYFGDFVYYCDPVSEESIRSAILKALEGPPRPGLKERIAENYTWGKAALETLEGYRVALADK
jgi:glycosyltransferase involved in cell wall biosynthesis